MNTFATAQLYLKQSSRATFSCMRTRFDKHMVLTTHAFSCRVFVYAQVHLAPDLSLTFVNIISPYLIVNGVTEEEYWPLMDAICIMVRLASGTMGITP